MIVSTTLTGNNEGIVADALRSVVDAVDVCLVIDTGVSDRSLDVARDVAGDKLVVRPFDWIDDFSAARNFALDAALELGGSWALTVDTDERILFEPGVDLGQLLATSDFEILNVQHVSGLYSKERIFRLPHDVRWVGPTHEGLTKIEAGKRGTLSGVVFDELEKTEAQMQRKFLRDREILKKQVRRSPKEPRWFFYLGESHFGLREYRDAIAAYGKCADLNGWEEEGAWACFKAASAWCELGEWRRAIETCARGLSIRPATAELAWLAGWASYRAGRYVDAIAWSQMAIANGRCSDSKVDDRRVGFSEVRGLYEGPYDVLRYSFRALGDVASASRYDQEFARIQESRTSGS